MVLVIYISLLCLTSSFIFFFKKQKIIDLKKASRPKFCNIIFLFFLKIGSIGPIDQQLNLFSPYLWKRCFDWTFLRYVPNETSTSLNLNDFRPKAPPGGVLQKGALKNFAIYTGKYLCWSPFLIKLQVILKNISERLLLSNNRTINKIWRSSD